MTESRIPAAFARARAEKRIAIVPFLTAGFPTLSESEEVFLALVRGGADLIEIGVPFSDPLADGATIQRSSEVAIANGVRLSDCIALVRSLREKHGVTIPLILMGYYNPILHYGLAEFGKDAAAAGVDGVIVPDLPTEESDELLASCRANGLDLIFLLAPTSTDQRIDDVAARASGFVYCVSLTGVTGGRNALPDLRPYLSRFRAKTDLPLAIGFGISTPDHIRQVSAVGDGAIVGSSMINLIDQAPEGERAAAAETFIRGLAAAAKS